MPLTPGVGGLAGARLPYLEAGGGPLVPCRHGRLDHAATWTALIADWPRL